MPGTPLQKSVFVSIIDTSGTSLLASAVFGGESTDSIDRIALAPNGDVLLAGITSSKPFPVTPGALRNENFGPPSAFLTRLTADLSAPVFSTFLDRYTQVTMLTVDSGEFIVLTGNTDSRFFPVTADALKRGFSPGFLARLSGDGSAILYASYFKIFANTFLLTNAALTPDHRLIIAAQSAGYHLSFYGGPSLAAGLMTCPPLSFSRSIPLRHAFARSRRPRLILR